MSVQFVAKSNTGRELFSAARFDIPIYQRDYAWESEEYQALWEDLQGGLDEGGYFLGLIILTQSSPQSPREVVDGQQRIISISLLAAALRDKAMDDGRTILSSEIERDFLKTLDMQNDDYVPRVTFSEDDDATVFNAIVDGTFTGDRKSHPMAAAYHHFRDQLEDDLEQDGFQRLGAWTTFLQDYLYFAVFTHPDPSSAYTVFEVVNTRGRNLADADLIKNSLLRLTDEKKRMDVYTRWTRLATSFDEYHENTFVQFVRHVAMLRRGYILPKELHKKVTKNEGLTHFDTLLPDLEKHLDLYLQIVDPANGGPASDEASRAFAGFNALGVSAVRPLLLALGPESDDDFEYVLRITVQIVAGGSLGGVNLERKFSDAATSARSRKAWKSTLKKSAPSAEDFVADVARRKMRKSVLQLLQRSILQGTVLPTEDDHLQFIRPAVAPKWKDFSDAEFTESGMTLGNTFMTERARRPKNCQTWEQVKSDLLPLAKDTEHKRRLSRQSKWTPREARTLGAYLAERASDVWY
ncbi:DUF262 domain-containing protein [Nocardioides sp. C4-1]|uniref:DUF262 domain-containing protein n=1 Tax=Nocardioides sp. C4-1 TaxID=3151851 RepID=UPI003266302D